MKKILRGFHFKSNNGADYYYDDYSAMVYPCNDNLRDLLMSMNSDKANYIKNSFEGLLSPEERFIKQRHIAYGAFFKSTQEIDYTPLVNIEELTSTIKDNGFRQLILTVTEGCNLKCKYCVNSEIYPYMESLPTIPMSFETAKKAVDYYFDTVCEIRKKDPCRTPVVTFYGGEPLLMFPLIKKLVHYIKNERGEDNVLFTMSTNGLLLKNEIADFLIENKFAIWISIDGPKEDHDRNRIKHNGEGSFTEIYKNVNALWDKYPKYKMIGFLVTYDWNSDVRKLMEFFTHKEKFKQAFFMFNPVGFHFTDYYKKFTEADREKFLEGIQSIKKQFREMADEYNNPLFNFFIANPYRVHLMRRILSVPGNTFIPGTSCCIPGEKICILPDGSIQPCERVPGLANIGTVDEGLNYKKISKLISMYNESIVKNCKGCNIQQICNCCFSHFWDGKELRKPYPEFCKEQLANSKVFLAEVYSLLEENHSFYDRVLEFFDRDYASLLTVEF